MNLSKIRLHYKYLKHKIRKTPRYLFTKRVESFLQNADADTPPTGTERAQLLRHLHRYLIEMFNYPFMLKYHYLHAKVYRDYETGLRYILTEENRRLFFKRSMKVSHIRSLYRNLYSEQDKLSPHNYCFHDLSINPGSVFADIGAAEGIFTLKFIDKIKTAYLFECDNGWSEALQATFHPWKEKVIIVDKYVSEEDDDKYVSLDNFFSEREKPTLIKIDVEGAEREVLKGAGKLLDEGIDDILVCTYHQKGDEHNLSELLWKKNYTVVPSSGYMLMMGEPGYSPETPFEFRRGLIHASKLISESML